MNSLKFLLRGSKWTCILILSTVSLVLLLPVQKDASAQTRVLYGTLKCEVDGGINFIIGSKRKLHCVFRKKHERTSAYIGEIKKWGVSLGITTGGIFVWTVLGSTGSLPNLELTGTYLGKSADVAVGIGAGVNALIGGSKNNVVLQPISIEGEKGIDLTVSVISALTLRPLFKTTVVRNVIYEKVDIDQHYGCGSYVVVHKGDTLTRIAELCGVTVEALLNANSKIENVRELRISERVRIPIQTGRHSRSPCGAKIILKPNERVVSLAKRCGVTLHALIVANPEIENLVQIKPGLVFNVPSYL